MVDVPKENIKKELCDLPGVGPATAEKLLHAGVASMEELAFTSPAILAERTGLTKAKAGEIIRAARERVFAKAKVVRKLGDLEKFWAEHVQVIPTDIPELDRALDHTITVDGEKVEKRGLPTDSLVLVAGPFSSGKTQFCIHMAAQCVKHLKRGVVFAVTEHGTYHPRRIREVFKARGVPDEEIDEKVRIIGPPPTATPGFLDFVVDAVEKIIEEGLDVGLVVIDSFTAPLRETYGPSGREALKARSEEMARILARLHTLASKHNLCVLCTAQVYARPDMFGGHEIWGGSLQLHGFPIILTVSRVGKRDEVDITVLDVSYLARETVRVRLTDSGLAPLEAKPKTARRRAARKAEKKTETGGGEV
ncbi:MAG: hypothetical protein DRN06_05675, partial [Thermoprotei archaeon]